MSGAAPLVSVVVPVRDDAVGLAKCLAALRRQTYPPDRFEVIVVDNGSADASVEVARAHGAVCEAESARGSYAARNRGLKAASGEIVAFTDADCVPDPDWLEALVRRLREGADLVGGEVRFTVDAASSAAELFDSISSMQIGRNIRERRVAKTANLACWRRVVDGVGAFPAEMRSGGDVAWTRAASEAGYLLAHGADAIVAHPPRSLLPLLAKHVRVGRGQPRAWRRSGRSLRGYAWATARLLAPALGPAEARRQLRAGGINVGATRLLAVVAAGWLARLARLAGNVAGLGGLRPSSKES